MLKDLKRRLLENPDNIRQLLELYEYSNIKYHGNRYISFGRDESARKDAIVLWLQDNDYLNVKDFSKNISKDLISYIIEQRHTDFKSVISNIKSILGIEDNDYHTVQKRLPFGGLYQNINKKNSEEVKVYPESELDRFEKIPNIRFLKDYISIQAQQHFGIRYDADSESIIIPIRNPEGQLMGCKGRKNYSCDENKYWYPLPCRFSQTLFGYAENYQYLTGNTVMLLESEKAVMQCWSYGIKNVLGIGAGTISDRQLELIYNLNPTQIILLHDVGYDKEAVFSNVRSIKKYSRLQSVEVCIWDNFDKKYPDKVSPTDMGATEFVRILDTEIIKV